MLLKLVSNKYLTLVFRLALGVIFLIASFDKIVSPADFASSIRNYRILPLSAVNIMAIIMPWLEFFCGIFLILGVFIRTSSLLILLMLIVFATAILSAIFRGLDIDCGCFKNSVMAGKVGWSRFFEDILMIAMGLQVFFFPNRFLSIEKILSKTSDNDKSN